VYISIHLYAYKYFLAYTYLYTYVYIISILDYQRDLTRHSKSKQSFIFSSLWEGCIVEPGYQYGPNWCALFSIMFSKYFMYVYIYVCMNIYLYVFMYRFVYLHVCMYICKILCMNMNIYRDMKRIASKCILYHTFHTVISTILHNHLQLYVIQYHWPKDYFLIEYLSWWSRFGGGIFHTRQFHQPYDFSKRIGHCNSKGFVR
jgi:hypothetical protein